MRVIVFLALVAAVFVGQAIWQGTGESANPLERLDIEAWPADHVQQKSWARNPETLEAILVNAIWATNVRACRDSAEMEKWCARQDSNL